MKIVSVFFALLIASAAQATTYKCAEKADKALEEGRLQYSVIVKELEEITDPEEVGEDDSATRVKITILSRDPEVGGRFELNRPSFFGIARQSDVMYRIVRHPEGFRFNMYLDELDQTSVKIKGVKQTIGMNCSSSN